MPILCFKTSLFIWICTFTDSLEIYSLFELRLVASQSETENVSIGSHRPNICANQNKITNENSKKTKNNCVNASRDAKRLKHIAGLYTYAMKINIEQNKGNRLRVSVTFCRCIRSITRTANAMCGTINSRMRDRVRDSFHICI